MKPSLTSVWCAATAALLSRRDVLIVASVSCIYGLGSPAAWNKAVLSLKVGESVRRDGILRHLVHIQYVYPKCTVPFARKRNRSVRPFITIFTFQHSSVGYVSVMVAGFPWLTA